MLKKSTIALLTLTIALGLIYIIFFYTPKPFNDLDLSRYNNMVNNYSSVSYADTVAHVALDQLNIIGAHVVILDIPDNLIDNFKIEGDQVDGFVITNTLNSYSVYMNKNLSRSNYILILGHEMIHVNQVHTGRLILKDHPNIVFDSNSIHLNDYPYRLRPWEKEAYDGQNKLRREMNNILFD